MYGQSCALAGAPTRAHDWSRSPLWRDFEKILRPVPPPSQLWGTRWTRSCVASRRFTRGKIFGEVHQTARTGVLVHLSSHLKLALGCQQLRNKSRSSLAVFNKFSNTAGLLLVLRRVCERFAHPTRPRGLSMFVTIPISMSNDIEIGA